MNGGFYTPEVLPPELGGYTLRSCLKHGAEQQVYLLERDGCKYIAKRAVGREGALLREEYATLSALEFGFLPRALDLFEAGDAVWFLRTYAEGKTLAEQVEGRGPMDARAAAEAGMSVCAMLANLHGASPPIVHRDVKPQNIVVTDGGAYLLIDMGSARRWREEATGDTVVVGTRATAAPEQFGYRQTDLRADIYGVGMLLVYLLTGEYDRDGPALKDVPPPLRRVVERCTAFDPEKRYESAEALSRALRRAVSSWGRLPRWWPAVPCAALAALALCLLPWRSGPQAVTFQEPLIEQAVRQELGLSGGETIPRERLGEVTKLILCGQEVLDGIQAHDDVAWMRHDPYTASSPQGGVADLSELALLPGLRTLVLDYQQVADISPLAGLPLEYLSLCGNQISDLSPLASCMGLTVLDVSQNPVRDGDVFARMPALVSVNLNQTQIDSLASFDGSAVQALRVWEAPVIDYTPLRNCRKLRSLETGNLGRASITELSQITTLQRLSLFNCAGFSFHDLTGLNNLQELDLSSCSYGSLEGLEQFTRLTYLNLSDTALTDVAPLKKLPILRTLELRENPVSDFSPLLECPGLTLVILEETQRQQAERQLANAPFALEIRS